MHIRFDESSGEEDGAPVADYVDRSVSEEGKEQSAVSSRNKQRRGRKRKKSAEENISGTSL